MRSVCVFRSLGRFRRSGPVRVYVCVCLLCWCLRGHPACICVCVCVDGRSMLMRATVNYDWDPGQFHVEIHAEDLSECSYEVIKDKVRLRRAVKHAAGIAAPPRCGRVNAPQRHAACSIVCLSGCLPVSE
jgi:hypothetical protein